MTFLFEDDISKFPYNILLKSCKYPVVGSRGNKNIPSKMRELGSDIIVFVDTVADNPVTVSYYNKAVKLSRCLPNTYVFPIPCIEYIFIRSFIGYYSAESTVALKFDDFMNCTLNCRQLPLVTTKGFENFCKDVVRQARDCYATGVFVTEDCLCKDKLSDCSELTIYLKGIKLMSSLPIFLNNFSTSAFSTRLRECENLYYRMGESFKRQGLIKQIPRLIEHT